MEVVRGGGGGGVGRKKINCFSIQFGHTSYAYCYTQARESETELSQRSHCCLIET